MNVFCWTEIDCVTTAILKVLKSFSKFIYNFLFYNSFSITIDKIWPLWNKRKLHLTLSSFNGGLLMKNINRVFVFFLNIVEIIISSMKVKKKPCCCSNLHTNAKKKQFCNKARTFFCYIYILHTCFGIKNDETLINPATITVY